MDPTITLTLPFPPQAGTALIVALALACALVFVLLGETARTGARPRRNSWIITLVKTLSPVWIALLLGAVAAAFAIIAHTISQGLRPAGPGFGAGALIAALLGAPFLIWAR